MSVLLCIDIAHYIEL